MTTEHEEIFKFQEEDCPHDCECCPLGLSSMECAELYEEYLKNYGNED